MLGVVTYLLQSHSASVKQRAGARKLEAGSAQALPDVSVVLLQRLKQEPSINYHDYLKRRRRKGGGGRQGKGRAWLLAVPSLCCSSPGSALTSQWHGEAEGRSWEQFFCFTPGNWVSFPPLCSFSMAKSAEVKLAIFGRAGVGKSGMFDFWSFLCLSLGHFLLPLCRQTLHKKGHLWPSCERGWGQARNCLFLWLFVLFSLGATK